MQYFLHDVPLPYYLVLASAVIIFIAFRILKDCRKPEKRNWISLYVVGAVGWAFAILYKIILEKRADIIDKYINVGLAMALVWFLVMLFVVIRTTINQYRLGYIKSDEMRTFLKRLKWVGIIGGICIVTLLVFAFVLPE
ncbi:MAG: hypothetical protein LBS96_09890 [Oscillospiraceae bacterium]|jgi:hypothetical protein|nr:hypothetical protein [Oscillospiraceae bacterium]